MSPIMEVVLYLGGISAAGAFAGSLCWQGLAAAVRWMLRGR